MTTKTKTERKPGLDDLDAIRATIRSKESQLEEIHSRTITKEEAEDRVGQYIAWATADIKAHHFQQLSFLNPSARDSDLNPLLSSLTPLELEIWLHPKQLKDQLRLVVDEFFERYAASNGSGLSFTERAAQTADLEAELQVLFLEEERIFVALKEAGLEPIRRGGENPQVVYEVIED